MHMIVAYIKINLNTKYNNKFIQTTKGKGQKKSKCKNCATENQSLLKQIQTIFQNISFIFVSFFFINKQNFENLFEITN